MGNNIKKSMGLPKTLTQNSKERKICTRFTMPGKVSPGYFVIKGFDGPGLEVHTIETIKL